MDKFNINSGFLCFNRFTLQFFVYIPQAVLLRWTFWRLEGRRDCCNCTTLASEQTQILKQSPNASTNGKFSGSFSLKRLFQDECDQCGRALPPPRWTWNYTLKYIVHSTCGALMIFCSVFVFEFLTIGEGTPLMYTNPAFTFIIHNISTRSKSGLIHKSILVCLMIVGCVLFTSQFNAGSETIELGTFYNGTSSLNMSFIGLHSPKEPCRTTTLSAEFMNTLREKGLESVRLQNKIFEYSDNFQFSFSRLLE